MIIKIIFDQHERRKIMMNTRVNVNLKTVTAAAATGAFPGAIAGAKMGAKVGIVWGRCLGSNGALVLGALCGCIGCIGGGLAGVVISAE